MITLGDYVLCLHTNYMQLWNSIVLQILFYWCETNDYFIHYVQPCNRGCYEDISKVFFFLNYVKSSSTKFIAALNCKKILRIHCRRRSYLSVMVTVVSLRAEHWSNWLAVRTILPAWFDCQAEIFSHFYEGQFWK